MHDEWLGRTAGASYYNVGCHCIEVKDMEVVSDVIWTLKIQADTEAEAKMKALDILTKRAELYKDSTLRFYYRIM